MKIIMNIVNGLYTVYRSKICIKLFLAVAIIYTTNAKKLPVLHYSFNTWKRNCEKLPGYKPDYIRSQFSNSNYQNILSAQELSKALSLYFDTLLADTELFLNKRHWVNQMLPEQLIASLQQENMNVQFDPFVEKIILSDKSIIAFHGDIHGDIHSLLAFITHLQKRGFLKDFEIKNKDFYMVFLGDYTDRGLYGPEVIYTILRLKIANPQRVFLIRGNHEDRKQNKCEKADKSYFECFWSQLELLYNKKEAEELFEKINKFYESMPLALYLGCSGKGQTDYLLCCHGGIEMGFDPHLLLNHNFDHSFTKLGDLRRLDQLQKLSLKENEHILNFFKEVDSYINTFEELLFNITCFNNMHHVYLQTFQPKSIITPQYLKAYNATIGLFIGFQWNDYEVEKDPQSCFIKNSLGRGFVIGRTFNKAILALNSDEKNKIHGVFRAHQHIAYSNDPMMKRILNKDNLDFSSNKGVGRLWISQETLKNESHQLWDNIVCTFNVSPNTIYQLAGYNEDTYGLLTLATGYENWRLDIINQKTIKN